MIDALKRELAAVLVDEHGAGALAVAMAQLRRYTALGDASAVATWTAIAEIVRALLDRRRPPRRTRGKGGTVTSLARRSR
jgi:hypothetical protein